MKGLYVIVDVKDALEDRRREIPQMDKPRFLFEDRGLAESELLEMQKRFRCSEFVLFKSKAIAREADGHPNVLFVEPVE